jgi:hypothetical protein
MTTSQVTAALGLLKKVVPDASTIELTGPDGSPLPALVNVTLTKPDA